MTFILYGITYFLEISLLSRTMDLIYQRFTETIGKCIQKHRKDIEKIIINPFHAIFIKKRRIINCLCNDADT
jgi:hypothetical protein